jgi:hypothetical protein
MKHTLIVVTDDEKNGCGVIRRDVFEDFPKVVCLCGSTRFMEAFQEANLQETLAGNIVLSVGCNTKSDVGLGITPEKKVELDALHKRKIDLADEILVLNVGGYVGESTRSEIDYASERKKKIRYLEKVAPWFPLQCSLLFMILALSTITATAQERPARTLATVGFTLTKSTAEDSAPAIAGLDVRLAYDLRRGLQIVGEGEYRSVPAIRNLFTGYYPNRALSEMRYGAKLVYHFPVEGRVRPFVAGGVSVTRHFFDDPLPPVGGVLYNSSVNPTVTAGAAIGRNEVAVTRYLADTYSYSDLQGWGVDYANARKISGRLHLRSGVRFKRWSFYHGGRAVEIGGFVGFQFQ